MISVPYENIALNAHGTDSAVAAWRDFRHQLLSVGVPVDGAKDTYYRLPGDELLIVITTACGAFSLQHTISPADWHDIAAN